MKRLINPLRVCLLAVALVVMSCASAFAATDWENSYIEVQGFGAAPTYSANATQARMMARRAAVVDAYRQIAEEVSGVQVDSETTVENLQLTNDTIRTKVSAVVKGAKVVGEQAVDGGYTVTVRVAMFGVSGSLASAVLPATTTREAFPSPVAEVTPSVPTTTTPADTTTTGSTNVRVDVTVHPGTTGGTVTTPGTTTPTTPATTGSSAAAAPAGTAIGGYTGLIVDCRGLGLVPVMSPVIKNDRGEPIYGYKNLDSATVIANGMAGYVTDLSRATRAGSNPLVVKAIRVERGNPVISTADANRALIENGATGFLDKTNVVFVR